MISFTEITNEEELRRAVPDVTEAAASAVTELLADADSVAVCATSGCLIVRILLDGEWGFYFPLALCDGADERDAVLKLGAYAVYQEISLVIIDIPIDKRHVVESVGFRNLQLECISEDGDYFMALVLTECALLDEIPEVKGERLTLSALTESDERAYAALCRDTELNKYWGYDYREDRAEADDGYFISEVRRELDCGTALTLAVREGEELVGDVVIYGYDLFGNAAAGVRIAREFQGRGYGREAAELMFSLAREMGLDSIRASIMKANIPSMTLFSGMMTLVNENEDKCYFERKLI